MGLAINGAASNFVYEFGTPGVVTVEGEIRGAMTAPTSIISLGNLQVWVVTPIPIGFNVLVPPGVAACNEAVTMSGLALFSAFGNLSQVRVAYDESIR